MVVKVGHADAGVSERWSLTVAGAVWVGVSALVWAGIVTLGVALF